MKKLKQYPAYKVYYYIFTFLYFVVILVKSLHNPLINKNLIFIQIKL